MLIIIDYIIKCSVTHNTMRYPYIFQNSGVPRDFVGGGVQQIQLKTGNRENGDLGGGSSLVRGSGGSCNFVQEISFHIVKFS